MEKINFETFRKQKFILIAETQRVRSSKVASRNIAMNELTSPKSLSLEILGCGSAGK